MPYVDVVGDVWRATLAVSFENNQIQETNMHLQILASGGNDSRFELLADINTNYGALINPFMPNTTTYLGSRLSYAKTSQPFAPAIVSDARVGSGGPQMMASQVRPVISLKTDLVGRAFRGRMYGFTPEISQITPAGAPAAAMASSWKSLVDRYRLGLTVLGSNWVLVIYHRQKIPLAPVPVPTQVRAVVAPRKFGTQRRSGDYGRTNLPPW